MSSRDLVFSQLAVLPDYAQMASTYWRASRHPENLRDVYQTAREEAAGSSVVDRAVYAGTVALTAVQQLPVNEVLVGMGAGAVMEATGSLPKTVATAALITGTAEVTSGLGVAYSLSKIRGAMGIINQRYFKDKTESAHADEKKASEVARIYAVGSLALTSGATFYEDARVKGRSLRDNIRTALIAAPLVTMNYAGVTLLTMGGAKGVEKGLGIEGASAWLGDKVSDPVVMGSIVGLAMAGVGLIHRQKTIKTIEAVAAAPEESTPIEESRATEDNKKSISKKSPRFKRFRNQGTSVTDGVKSGELA